MNVKGPYVLFDLLQMIFIILSLITFLIKIGAVFLFVLPPKWTSFIEDTALTGAVVRQTRELDGGCQKGSESTAANHGHCPPCPLSWSLTRDGQTRLKDLTIATKHWTRKHLIMAWWCLLLPSRRGEVQSQGCGFLGCSSKGQELLWMKNQRCPTVRAIKIQFSAPGDLLILLAYT